MIFQATMKYLTIAMVLVNLCQSELSDWLIKDIKIPTSLTETAKGNLLLSNGLVSREFTVKPGFATVDVYCHYKNQSLLRSLNSEAAIELDYLPYKVGGVILKDQKAYLNRTKLAASIKPDKKSFQYVSHSTSKPIAPFPYTPSRGFQGDLTWPPKGLHLSVLFQAPSSAPASHRDIKIFVHYEMYDGIPLMSKWLEIESKQDVNVGVQFVERLGVNRQWGVTQFEWVSMVQPTKYNPPSRPWLYLAPDQPHGASVEWDQESGPRGASKPQATLLYSQGQGEHVPMVNGRFISFHVHELLVGTDDPERYALATQRMATLLAPQTRENPLYFQMTKSDSTHVRHLIDQMAEVGLEMMIYSFKSGFDYLKIDPDYLKKIHKDVQYAQSKGIEVGGFLNIALHKQVQTSWKVIDPETFRPGKSACLASGWYDHVMQGLDTFMNSTGLSMIMADGTYSGDLCAATDHVHHKGLSDSINQQFNKQSEMFLRLREKSVYIQQPDWYIYQGASRSRLSSEDATLSLPLWEDLSINRQRMYDDLYSKAPTQASILVPLIDYPVDECSQSETQKSTYLEYEWMHAQYLTAGIGVGYRSSEVFDNNATKSIMQKWLLLYKQYRGIITSEIIHVRRPDMQSIDAFMHVNPRLIHKGLAIVFNPTDQQVNHMLSLPLYYTGLTDVALVTEVGNNAQNVTLNRNYNIEVPVKLGPFSYTIFIIQ